MDNKGQNFIHLFSICELFKKKQLQYNAKILIEGNEESGNPDLPHIIKENTHTFASDYTLVSDGEIIKNNPVMESSLRGGGNMCVVFTTAKNNFHSGLFGGAVPNAALELIRILSKLKDNKNIVQIEDFYNNSLVVNEDMLRNNACLGTQKDVLKLSGVKQLLTINNFDFYTQTGCLPTLEISGIKSGYTEEGFANIVPSTAEARINVRVTGKQKTKRILLLIASYIKNNTSPYVRVDIQMEQHGDAIVLNTNFAAAQDIALLLEQVYKKKVLKKYVGGSIPILGDFQRILKSNVISVSLGNNDCNMHGVDENFRIDLIEKGLLFARNFWGKK